MRAFKRIIRILPIAFCIAFFALTASVFAETEYDGYIIQFKDEASEKRGVEIINNSATLLAEDDFWEISDYHEMYKLSDLTLVEKLSELGLLEYAEPDYICELYGYDYSAEPYFSKQWQHEATGIKRAWELGIYWNDTTVVVIDSGVQKNHPDFDGNVADGHSVTSTPATTDYVGHGTFVAGMIAASANKEGVVGAAHKATVVPVKITDTMSVPESLLADAIIDSVDNYMPDVINLSLGYAISAVTTNVHNSIRQAVNYALMFDVIVVAACGNGTSTEHSYPASLDGVISVSNLQKLESGAYAWYSSHYNDKVTIAAPGASVYSTYNDGGYRSWTGTSFSAPYVSAVAALARSVDPDLTPDHFKELLIATADKSLLGGAERTNYLGYGVVNAGALLEALIDEVSPNGYVSPPDTTPEGVTSVCVYNPTASPKSWSFIAKGEQNGRPMGFVVANKSLPSEDVVEVEISRIMGYDKRFYLLDSMSLRPVVLG